MPLPELWPRAHRPQTPVLIKQNMIGRLTTSYWFLCFNHSWSPTSFLLDVLPRQAQRLHMCLRPCGSSTRWKNVGNHSHLLHLQKRQALFSLAAPSSFLNPRKFMAGGLGTPPVQSGPVRK